MRDRFPKASRPIKSDEGIASRRARGAFVESWWAERWIAALESVMDPGRLQRGRRYARAGQVLSLELEKGVVVARVQGSRRTPYRVTIGLTPLSDAAWDQAIGALPERADLAAALLAGEMPPAIDELFGAANASLFPTTAKQLLFTCSCPDWATVCKHVAASCYLLGEQLDEDPFLLFALRGRDQAALLEGLQQSAPGYGDGAEGAPPEAKGTGAAGAGATVDGEAPPRRTTDREPLALDGFYDSPAPAPSPGRADDAPELALLRRLGPFAPLDADLIALLAPLYREVAAAAERSFAISSAPSTDSNSSAS